MIEIRGENVTQWAGDLDEVVGHNCFVHLERMSEREFCLIIEDADKRVMISLGTAKRAYLGAFVYGRESRMVPKLPAGVAAAGS